MLELTRRRIPNRGKHTILTLIMTAAVVLALTGIGGATPIPGAFPTWNGGNLSVAVTTACINFYNASIDACPPGVAANFNLNNPSDAIFGTVPTTVGTTKDYLSANQASFAPGVQAYSGGVAFMVLNGFTFDVTSINVPNIVACPPVGAPASCSVEDLVFTQENLTGIPGACPGGVGPCGSVSVSFSANGIGYVSGSNPVTTGSTPFTFNYSSQFNNETIAHLLFVGNTGQITDSVSITANGANVTVPEPMALSLVGLGLLGIGGFSRLRRRRAPRARA